MRYATPGSRSAIFSLPMLALIVAGACAGLFTLLAIIFWFFLADKSQGFMAYWGQVILPGWPQTLLILAAVQAVRIIATQGTGKSWPWVLLVFILGLAADFLLKQQYFAQQINRIAASGIIATMVYIFFFTRWFSGASTKTGD